MAILALRRHALEATLEVLTAISTALELRLALCLLPAGYQCRLQAASRFLAVAIPADSVPKVVSKNRANLDNFPTWSSFRTRRTFMSAK